MACVNYITRPEGQCKVNTVVWTIPNFSYLLESKSTREIRAISSEKISEPRFQIKMQFLGRNNDIIELYYLYPGNVFLRAILTLCMNRFEERSIVMKEYHTLQANKWQYFTTLLNRDIMNGVDGTGSFFLSDGSLRLKFQFYVTNDIRVDGSNVPAPELCHDLESLLHDGMFSDVTMISSDGKEFHVHKAVLAIRSAVLKAHFEHNTIECKTNIVETSLEAEVLEDVLNFIYSDRAPKLDEIPEKLLAAADYYQLTRLKSLCEEALQKNLTVENAIDTLQLADLHSASMLKQLTLEFIKDGQAKLITRTAGWAELKSVELIKTIYKYITSEDVDTDIK